LNRQRISVGTAGSSYESKTGELIAKGITSFGEFAFGNVAVSAEDQGGGFDVPGSIS